MRPSLSALFLILVERWEIVNGTLLAGLGLSWSGSRKIRRQLRNQELLKDTGDSSFTKSDEHA